MEITLSDFNAIQSARKSKMADIVNKIVMAVKTAKTGVEMTASELYGKPEAHYYNLSLALKNSEEFKAVAKDWKFVMSGKTHANFEKLAVLKK